MLSNIPLPQVGDELLKGFEKVNALHKENLANRAAELTNQFYPQKTQAEINHQNAIADLAKEQLKYYPQLTESEIAKNKLNSDYPLLGMAGPAGQVGAAMYLQGHGSNPLAPPSSVGQGGGSQLPMPTPGLINSINQMGGKTNVNGDYANTILNAMNQQLNQKQASADYNKIKTQGYEYSHLPVSSREALLAQAAGMGVDPTVATHKFMNGQSIDDIAKEQGFDPKDLPSPIYPQTKASQTQIQRRQQALAEVNTLNPKITEALAPYAQRFNGYSPKQIIESMKGENKHEQAKFFAAKALVPEMGALRGKVMGANIGVELVKELTHASMNNIKAYTSLMDPEVYRESNQILDSWLTEAVGNANKVASKFINKEKEQNNEDVTHLSDDELHSILKGK